jgi:two-component system sensor histidine kinase TctE
MRERFYRLPGTPGEGNGLGLAIADEIALVHGSQLQINAGAQGRGLLCTLLLEAVRE